eukprot:1612542-Pyramimonas_sp.AAC.1
MSLVGGAHQKVPSTHMVRPDSSWSAASWMMQFSTAPCAGGAAADACPRGGGSLVRDACGLRRR